EAAGARRRHVHDVEPRRDRASGEEPLPAAEHGREGPQVELVDKVIPQERLDEVAAPVHLDLWSGLLLQLRHVHRHVALMSAELFHSTFLSVRDATCLRAPFNASAPGSEECGQYAAKISYVLRPRSNSNGRPMKSPMTCPMRSSQ